MSTPNLSDDLATIAAWADPGECEWMDGPGSYCVTHDAYGHSYSYGDDTTCRAVDSREFPQRQALVRCITAVVEHITSQH